MDQVACHNHGSDRIGARWAARRDDGRCGPSAAIASPKRLRRYGRVSERSRQVDRVRRALGWDAEARSGARFAQDHDRWNVFIGRSPGTRYLSWNSVRPTRIVVAQELSPNERVGIAADNAVARDDIVRPYRTKGTEPVVRIGLGIIGPVVVLRDAYGCKQLPATDIPGRGSRARRRSASQAPAKARPPSWQSGYAYHISLITICG